MFKNLHVVITTFNHANKLFVCVENIRTSKPLVKIIVKFNILVFWAVFGTLVCFFGIMNAL